MKEIANPVQDFKMGEKLSVLLLVVLLLVLILIGRAELDTTQVLFWGIYALVSLAAGILALLFLRLRRKYEEKVKELARKELELTIAQEVQRELFPRLPEATSLLDLSAVCRPAHGISGDYYDFHEMDDGQWGITVADISGKGISAALLMANVQAMVRSHFGRHHRISDLFASMNELLVRSTAPSRYATLFYGMYQSSEGVFSYVNAGHVPPMLVRGNEVLRLTEGGVPIGLLTQTEYQEGRVRLQPGDLLAIYSDGILEAVNGADEEFGDERLIRILSDHHHLSAGDLQGKVLERVEAWSQKAVPDDDMTLVLIKVPLPSS